MSKATTSARSRTNAGRSSALISKRIAESTLQTRRCFFASANWWTSQQWHTPKLSQTKLHLSTGPLKWAAVMMLGLHYTTPPEWADRVLADTGALLLDHLFCERKAAAMALHTMRVHGKRFPILKKLMPDLANEEFEHAAECDKMLKNYPPAPAPQGGSAYAQGLRKLTQTRGRDTFMDMLLVCGVIEARSAERFRLLADRARGTALGSFYEDLYASEVNHYLLFSNLAVDFYGEAPAQKRLDEIRVEEARLIQALPPGPRLH